MKWHSAVFIFVVFGAAFSLTLGARKLLRIVGESLAINPASQTAIIHSPKLTPETMFPAQEVSVTESTATATATAVAVPTARPGNQPDSWLQLAAKNLSTAEGEFLFTLLFNRDFRREENWLKLLPLIEKRLQAKLPIGGATHGSYSLFDVENRGRMGLLKALGKVEISDRSSAILKKFLMSYLQKSIDKTWLLEREAVGSLFQKFNLSDEEKAELIPKVDPRALGLANESDEGLITQVVRHAAEGSYR